MTTSLPRFAIVRFGCGALLVAAALALAACETTGAATVAPAAQTRPAAAEPQGPMTHQKAALYCWMKTEHGRADLPLDKRADVVDKCIEQKMQGN